MARYSGAERDAFRADLSDAPSHDLLRPGGLLDLGYCDDAHPIHETVAEAAYDMGLVAVPVGDLASIHLSVPRHMRAMDQAQISPFTAAFYEPGEPVVESYRRFVRDVVAPWVGEPIYYQRTPTIRFQFPRQEGFGAWPKWHSDVMLGHPPAEINVWLPLTQAYGTNTISAVGRDLSAEIIRALDGDFDGFDERPRPDLDAAGTPVELGRGRFAAFDPRCIHATQYNLEPDTRASIDFRVVPVRAYERLQLHYRGTGRNPMEFAPGEYYAEEAL